jgi:hypothetical protein
MILDGILACLLYPRTLYDSYSGVGTQFASTYFFWLPKKFLIHDGILIYFFGFQKTIHDTCCYLLPRWHILLRHLIYFFWVPKTRDTGRYLHDIYIYIYICIYIFFWFPKNNLMTLLLHFDFRCLVIRGSTSGLNSLH